MTTVSILSASNCAGNIDNNALLCKILIALKKTEYRVKELA
jgi:hypothetical protein